MLTRISCHRPETLEIFLVPECHHQASGVNPSKGFLPALASLKSPGAAMTLDFWLRKCCALSIFLSISLYLFIQPCIHPSTSISDIYIYTYGNIHIHILLLYIYIYLHTYIFWSLLLLSYAYVNSHLICIYKYNYISLYTHYGLNGLRTMCVYSWMMFFFLNCWPWANITLQNNSLGAVRHDDPFVLEPSPNSLSSAVPGDVF